ncbi:MAG TPA: hypothetical protein VN578_15415 [Candidatus Binatia bacterium]|jgi:hypothetical protein|nr:hypothetical protein [Candidatus Binatia bacterium]
MSELDLLFLVLAVLYGWECSWWVPRGSVAFRTWLGRRWRSAQPGDLLGNQRGGLVFAHPLPPLGTLLVANQFPLSLSPEALLAFVAPSINPGGRPAQTGKLFRFEDIRTIEARARTVQINGEPLLKTPSPNFAEHLVEHLRLLQKLPPAKREEEIQRLLADTLGVRAAKDRWEDFQGQTARLRWFTNCLFAYLFLSAPVLIWQFGLRHTWPGLLLGLLALTLTTAILFYRAHKHFYPRAVDERFTHFLLTLLAPASTIRAHDVLSRPLFEDFHPLTLAKLFCTAQQFRDYARFVLTEIRHPALPVCPREEPAAREAERQARLRWQKLVENFLEQNGLNPDEILRPPAPADETCSAYCPRCLTQFTAGTEACEDCGGLALVKFPAAGAAPARIAERQGRG